MYIIQILIAHLASNAYIELHGKLLRASAQAKRIIIHYIMRLLNQALYRFIYLHRKMLLVINF